MPCRLSSRAEQDLDEVWFYVAEDASPTTADRLIDDIVATRARRGGGSNSQYSVCSVRAGNSVATCSFVRRRMNGWSPRARSASLSSSAVSPAPVAVRIEVAPECESDDEA